MELRARGRGGGVSPAYAGIDPGCGEVEEKRSGLPRVRGDRPSMARRRSAMAWSPPRTRGSTSRSPSTTSRGRVSPAYAGIDPRAIPHPRRSGRLPRVRGDRPRVAGLVKALPGSPPRTRGSTCRRDRAIACRHVSPAYAGIDLDAADLGRRSVGLPRVRGDRPCCNSVPAMLPTSPPRTRGSTRLDRLALGDGRVSPAYAGIDLTLGPDDVATISLPRVRGDRPWRAR